MHLSIYALRRSICASLHFALDIPIRSCPNRIDMRPFGARDGLCPLNPNFSLLSIVCHKRFRKYREIFCKNTPRIAKPFDKSCISCYNNMDYNFYRKEDDLWLTES